MPVSEYSPGGPLQQCVLEWQVQGRFDGTTAAQGVTITDNTIAQQPAGFGDPFVIEEEGNVGIFNVAGLGGLETNADRWIQWLRLVSGGNAPTAGFRMEIVDATRLVPSVGLFTTLEVIQFGIFSPALYEAEMRFVPQGAALRIIGLGPANPGSFHRLTLGIRSAKLAKEDAELQQASCCLFDPVTPVLTQVG